MEFTHVKEVSDRKIGRQIGEKKWMQQIGIAEIMVVCIDSDIEENI